MNNQFSAADVLNLRMLSFTSQFGAFHGAFKTDWPLPNVWLGVSVENQKAADERLPILLETPAAVRFLSCEPLLEKIDLGHLRKHKKHHMQALVDGMIRNRAWNILQDENGRELSAEEGKAELLKLQAEGVKYIKVGDCPAFSDETGCPSHEVNSIDWVIVGGESGSQSRPCNIDWIRSIVQQCAAAGTTCFVKQLGTGRVDYGVVHMQPTGDGKFEEQGRVTYLHNKGGNPDEWPHDLRVRQFPGESK